jgi:deoxyribonuclease V
LPVVGDYGYNQGMKIVERHGWRVGATRAREIQTELAGEVSRVSDVLDPHLIAGTDISVNMVDGTGTGAAVVLSYPELEIIEVRVVSGRLDFPYVPGLLSFREAPLVLEACARLTVAPDLIMVDGQGIAHPRRLGLASHLGLFLETPTIGCAKSRLCGEHGAPGQAPGSYAELLDGGEVVGAALRTRAGVNPVYVSIGHKIDLPSAIHWVLACCRGYRLPEPARLAHLAAGGNMGLGKGTAMTGGFQERLI